MNELTRRHFLGSLGSAAASIALTKAGAEIKKQERPNVILILTDDQAYGDFGCYGNTQVETPTLDKLHGESVRLSNFYVQPVCSPTRACLMTGRYCIRGNVLDTWVGAAMLRPEEVTLAQVLSQYGGYRTGMFGKWHLGDHYPLRPNDRGFQETLTFESGVMGQTGGPFDNHRINPTLLHNGKHEQYEGYCDDIFCDGAMRFIEANRDHPFFVYLPTHAVHLPLEVPDSYAAPYRAKGLSEDVSKLYGMVADIDHNVGRLLAKVEALGLEQNTVVIFMTDNGMGDPYRYNTGLRGVKGQVYEGGIKTPFFFRWPGRVKGNREIDRIAAHIDIFPTVLDICGVPIPPRLHLDGVSLLPLLQGNESDWPDRMLYFQQSRPDEEGWDLPRMYANSAVRGQQYKIVMATPPLQNDFPIPKTYGAPVAMSETELYDIEHDPHEEHNIASEHPDIVFEMRRKYEDWFSDVTKGLQSPVRNQVGSIHENPVRLAAQDMRGPHAPEAPWNWAAVHRMANKEPAGSGYFELQVVREGLYRVTLSYGPAGAKAIPVIKQGKAFLGIGNVTSEKPIEAGSASVTFEVNLKSGPCRLEAVFTGQRADHQVVSPFLIDVEFLKA
jgi:arylsulfatase A-like enzyme